ncbi:YHYH protein [Thalassotalea piscium]
MTRTLNNYHASSNAILGIFLACSLSACGSSSDSTTSTIETEEVANTAPIADAGADQRVFSGNTINLSGAQSSDADNDTLTYSWSLSSIPNDSIAVLSSESNVDTTFVGDVAGSYIANLTVNDGQIESELDSVEIIVSEVSAASTSGVLCDYYYNEYNDSPSVTYNSTAQWTCVNGERELSANGIPDHDVGTFPNSNNPNTISEQSINASFTLSPVETSAATQLGGPRGTTGFVLNGVKIDAGTGGSCDDSGDNCSLIGNEGSWHIEALGQTSFDFGTDENNAHVQPDGVYHYHGMPEGFITKQGGSSESMTIIAWAADGFPIYARYGYSIASDITSPITAMKGSYQRVTTVSESRPSTDIYPLGTFAEDWEYVAGSGDLDECNGRMGVTPEFPEGIYHYFATDTYPYFQRCVTGEVDTSGMLPPPPPIQ